MPYIIGFALAALTFLSARAAGFDRDGALYPVVLIVIASSLKARTIDRYKSVA